MSSLDLRAVDSTLWGHGPLSVVIGDNIQLLWCYFNGSQTIRKYLVLDCDFLRLCRELLFLLELLENLIYK